MTNFECLEGEDKNCTECDRISLSCHPFQVAKNKLERRQRGAQSALERKELEILKSRRHIVKRKGDDLYYMICQWLIDDPNIELLDITSALEQYKKEWNRLQVSVERCEQYQEAQKI
jgi:hypothetical protein